MKAMTGNRATVAAALAVNKQRGLTSMDAFRFKPACTRLADVVMVLKRHYGMPIVKVMERSEATGGKHARYFLKQYAPENAE